MKVLYDLQAFTFGPHGGIARMFSEVIARLAERDDFKACLFVPGRTAGPLPSGPGVSVRRWKQVPPSLRGTLLGRAHNRLAATARRLARCDIFHPTFYPAYDDMYRGNTVVNVYDLIHETMDAADDMPDHATFRALKRRAIASAERIVCISEATRKGLMAHYDVDPAIVRTVYLGPSPLFRRMDPDEAERGTAPLLGGAGRPFVLFVGSRQRYKNFHRLLSAYRRWSRNGETDLVVIGRPQQVHERALDDLLGRDGCVRYVGAVDDAQLCALYNRALCLVYPSLCEGFGIPVLEAMAAGCRVCLADIPVFREVAADHATYFDPDSVDAMIDALDRCADDTSPDRRRQGEERAATFSWDRCAAQIRDIYDELV